MSLFNLNIEIEEYKLNLWVST